MAQRKWLSKKLKKKKNMVTLLADAQVLCNEDAFALKPIPVSENVTILTLEFF